MTETAAPARTRPNLLLLLRIYLVAIAVPALLRLRLSRVSVLVEPRRPRSQPNEQHAQAVIAAVDWVMGSGWPLVRSGCLTRGVTLLYFLRRAGIEVELRFGVRELDGNTEGHCWLVRGGEPYLESRDPRPRFTEVCRVARGAALPVN
jgi:transglutaminase superfamily protein